MKQNCYNALDICVELSLFMEKGGGQKFGKESLHCLSELVCARWGGAER